MAEIVSIQINVAGEGQYFFRYLGPSNGPKRRELDEELPDVRVLPLNTSVLVPGLSLPVASGLTTL